MLLRVNGKNLLICDAKAKMHMYLELLEKKEDHLPDFADLSSD
jgi:hypothetical protein